MKCDGGKLTTITYLVASQRPTRFWGHELLRTKSSLCQL